MLNLLLKLMTINDKINMAERINRYLEYEIIEKSDTEKAKKLLDKLDEYIDVNF